MIHIVIDIETVENPKAHDLVKKKRYSAKANLKDPKKIEQDILVQKQKDLDKAALYWWTGRIVCLCAKVLINGEYSEKYKSITLFGEDEKEILSLLFDKVLEIKKENLNVPITLVGKNSKTFDVPFIIGRSLVHDIGLIPTIRPYRPISDIDEMFGYGSMASQASTLNNYAWGLGIEMKSAHGSHMKEMYVVVEMATGKEKSEAWKKIYDYCALDVEITAEMLKRFLKEYKDRTVPIVEPLDEAEIPFGPTPKKKVATKKAATKKKTTKKKTTKKTTEQQEAPPPMSSIETQIAKEKITF